MTIDPFATHGVLISSLMLDASQSQQPDPFLLLFFREKNIFNESVAEGRVSLTYADGFIDHRLDPLTRLDGTRTDSFRASFAEQTSHTRLVSQTELVSVLSRRKGERKKQFQKLKKIENDFVVWCFVPDNRPIGEPFG